MLLRTLYRMGLDYCVLPPAEEFSDVIVFSKDQLVSLIERSSSENSIMDIAKRVAQGIFKPVAIFKSDFSSSDFLSKGGITDPEELQVLVVDDEGANILSLKEALRPRTPEFPEWWEAPVPFAMCEGGKLHVNHTAMLMFGPDLKRLAIDSFPEKNEFLVALEDRQSPCSISFRRLEGDIFMLEDCTGDIAAARDITWWAAIGKAWVKALDEEKRAYLRCGDEEVETFRAGHSILPCEWEGELLGYFCVEEKAPEKRARAKPEKRAEEGTEKSRSRRTKIPSETDETPEKRGVEGKENETLKALGPQTLGLLTPSSRFTEKPEAEVAPADQKTRTRREGGRGTQKEESKAKTHE
jgi:hypothetical protein